MPLQKYTNVAATAVASSGLSGWLPTGPSGSGHFFNWETITFREFSGATKLRWSFKAGNWVGR
jgi:hypothetical protein